MYSLAHCGACAREDAALRRERALALKPDFPVPWPGPPTQALVGVRARKEELRDPGQEGLDSSYKDGKGRAGPVCPGPSSFGDSSQGQGSWSASSDSGLPFPDENMMLGCSVPQCFPFWTHSLG